MFNTDSVWHVEVTFLAAPPVRRIERASGVSQVEIDDHAIRCVISGSFQPFLESLRGHEVLGFTSIPEAVTTDPEPEGGGH
jgi:hypothetical protein